MLSKESRKKIYELMKIYPNPESQDLFLSILADKGMPDEELEENLWCVTSFCPPQYPEDARKRMGLIGRARRELFDEGARFIRNEKRRAAKRKRTERRCRKIIQLLRSEELKYDQAVAWIGDMDFNDYRTEHGLSAMCDLADGGYVPAMLFMARHAGLFYATYRWENDQDLMDYRDEISYDSEAFSLYAEAWTEYNIEMEELDTKAWAYLRTLVEQGNVEALAIAREKYFVGVRVPADIARACGLSLE